ncbi:hypothetical protein NDU88_000783 [Pleurodeles waltl]|uniref:Uncharacterized protein n=1 Tax=Pleurodeles waltl TaxID=8319 RepID=A0AAV7VVQ6_PLEWA|nr:hypothetical protein NDU88_000783 [Pleurodeles waltl]
MRAGRTRAEERAILQGGRSELAGTCSQRCTGRCMYLVAGTVGALAPRSVCSAKGKQVGTWWRQLTGRFLVECLGCRVWVQSRAALLCHWGPPV